MHPLLDNIMWHSLTGPHARFASGTGGARRFVEGFSPILGFENPEDPDFGALEAFCAPDESFYTDGWSGPVPQGWVLVTDSHMIKMVWGGSMPAKVSLPPHCRELTAADAPAALALATLTRPGPFGIRTPELGDYLGVFDEGKLIAMAGERMWAGNYREVSGICTDPDWTGKGLAGKLTLELVRRQLDRGQIPFLHVMAANATAHTLYERLGFRDYRLSPVRVIKRQ